MKLKHILLAAALIPAIASAQIYPLEVYASTKRAGTGQPIKFMRSLSNGIYVGLCTSKPGGQEMCDLAKDGTYKTESGLTFRTKKMGQLFSADGKRRCDYTTSGTLDCD